MTSPHATDLRRLIDVAAGRAPADLLLRGGEVVNVFSREVERADVAIAGERIAAVFDPADGSPDARTVVDVSGAVVSPGFIDAHVHIESSLLNPAEFARAIVPRGTTTAICDPHEIANVHGVEGIRYMLAAARGAPVDLHFMLSSCVPASPYESSGATLEAADLAPLFDEPGVLGLAEVMNFPGVVAGDERLLAKIAAAGERVVDGHAPGLSGRALNAYAAAGISSDHECTTADEAREKLRRGLTILIREGSQARNLDALLPAITPQTADRFCFCTDDKYVDDILREGQIDPIVRRAVAAGLDPLAAIRCASYNAARHFRLCDAGALAPGYLANIAVLDDLARFVVRRVYHRGRLAAENGVCLAPPASPVAPPAFGRSVYIAPLDSDAMAPPMPRGARVHVMHVAEGSLITGRSVEAASIAAGRLAADPARDLAKLCVVERHRATGRVGVGLVRGFGLRRGALASTVAHDAHNIVVAGVSDEDIRLAAEHLASISGGLCVVEDGRIAADLALPIAGLMSDLAPQNVAARLGELRAAAARVATALREPFMALSFLSLSVIPTLKLTDHGLFDVDAFKTIKLIESGD